MSLACPPRMPWAAVVPLGMALLVAGCGTPARHSQSGPGTLRLVQKEEPVQFDPHTVQDGPTIEVLMHVAEGLVQWTEQSTVGPCLAERWEISRDGRTYTFHLRPNVRFHNGRVMTAADVVYSLNRAASLPNSPVADTYLNDIVGFREVAANPANALRGVKAVDERTVQITIDRPRPYFLMKLTYPTGYVVASRELSGVEQAGGQITERNLVGTGPFKIAEYQVGKQIILEANPDYWAGPPRLQRIIRRIVGDATTRHAMFENGESDMLVLSMADAEQDRQIPDLKAKMHEFPRPAVYYFALNLRRYPPFRDRRVRQAFAHAIDRQAINRNIMQGFTTPAYGIIPQGIPGYDPNYRGLEFNPARARALLAEAGYADGSRLPPLELNFRERDPDIKRVCEAAAEMLRQNLGVQVGLREMEWGTFLARRARGEMNFYFLRWAADYPDPQNFLPVMLHSRAGQNTIGYHNPEFDRLCEAADTDMNSSRRLALYRRAERLAVEDAPWIPIYFQKDIELWNPKLDHSVRDCVMGHLPHLTTRLEP
ncbi:MAG: ABC transporter substrate-binding protein [Armatimonadetes bacterium]|nr:ABC transporter substrate-binding protein [Armatimonadota bacterium]